MLFEDVCIVIDMLEIVDCFVAASGIMPNSVAWLTSIDLVI